MPHFAIDNWQSLYLGFSSSLPRMTIRPKLAIEKSQLQKLLLLNLLLMRFQLIDVPYHVVNISQEV